MHVGEAGHAISKLCAGQATKNLMADGPAEPSYGHTGMEKRQMDVTQKGNMFRHIQTKKCVYM